VSGVPSAGSSKSNFWGLVAVDARTANHVCLRRLPLSCLEHGGRPEKGRRRNSTDRTGR
jgi:hypothetical protein